MANAVAEYKKRNYDTIIMMIPKGKKDLLKQAAQEAGAPSLSAWIAGVLEEKTGIDLVLHGSIPTKQK